jgi:hypothetical protein
MALFGSCLPHAITRRADGGRPSGLTGQELSGAPPPQSAPYGLEHFCIPREGSDSCWDDLVNPAAI